MTLGLVLSVSLLALGCGAPGMPGRAAGPSDPGHPFGGNEVRAYWNCSNRGCTGRCGGEGCGVKIESTGVKAKDRK
jgi:hypothetical protein